MDTEVLIEGAFTRFVEIHDNHGALLDKYHEVVYNGKVFGPLRSQREIDACLYKLQHHTSAPDSNSETTK